MEFYFRLITIIIDYGAVIPIDKIIAYSFNSSYLILKSFIINLSSNPVS